MIYIKQNNIHWLEQSASNCFMNNNNNASLTAIISIADFNWNIIITT